MQLTKVIFKLRSIQDSVRSWRYDRPPGVAALDLKITLTACELLVNVRTKLKPNMFLTSSRSFYLLEGSLVFHQSATSLHR